MVRLAFPAYEPNDPDSDEKHQLPLPIRVWALLYQAIFNNQSWQAKGDRRSLKAAAALLEAFEQTMEPVLSADGKPVGGMNRAKIAGSEVRVEDAAFDALKDAWKLFSDQLPNGLAREIVAGDEFLENAERIKLVTLVEQP